MKRPRYRSAHHLVKRTEQQGHTLLRLVRILVLNLFIDLGLLRRNRPMSIGHWNGHCVPLKTNSISLSKNAPVFQLLILVRGGGDKEAWSSLLCKLWVSVWEASKERASAARQMEPQRAAAHVPGALVTKTTLHAWKEEEVASSKYDRELCHAALPLGHELNIKYVLLYKRSSTAEAGLQTSSTWRKPRSYMTIFTCFIQLLSLLLYKVGLKCEKQWHLWTVTQKIWFYLKVLELIAPLKLNISGILWTRT